LKSGNDILNFDIHKFNINVYVMHFIIILNDKTRNFNKFNTKKTKLNKNRFYIQSILWIKLYISKTNRKFSENKSSLRLIIKPLLMELELFKI